MAIACDPGSGTVNCVRWAKIKLADASVADAGVYASDEYRSYADLAANACGDMAVGYTKSSSSIYPGISYTGRLSGDPAGVLQPETELIVSEIEYTAFDGSTYRWGDYTGMTIDPDGKTFWYLGQYSKDTGTTNGRWGTYIGSFSFAGCDGTGTPPANQPPTANASSDQTVTDSDENGSESVTLDGASSTDDVGIVSYVWTGTSVPANTTGATLTILLPLGIHTITLTVTDGEGLTDTDDVVITVQAPPANQPPTANAGSDQTVADSDENGVEDVTLNGAGSDPDGDTLTYVWTDGAGNVIANVASTNINNLAVGGPYTFRLTVGDGEFTDFDEVQITVQAPVVGGADPPVVSACDPSSGITSKKYTVAVTGAGFVDGATVNFEGRIAVQGVTFRGPKQLDVRIRVNKRATSGPKDVTVTNPDSNFGSLAGCFTVN